MPLLQQVERPAGRSPARWAFDLLVALAAYAAALPNLFDDGGSAQAGAGAVHGVAAPSAWSYAVLAGMVLPLVVRRVWPLPVFAWLAVAGLVVAPFDHRVIAALGLNVALYTVAALCPRREALAAAAALEAGALGVAAFFPAGDFWFDAIFLSVTVAASTALGLYVGTRRAYLLELRDRAERVERERDQQVALAAADERARIARELHDIVAHHLTVMVAVSDGAVAASARSPERGVEAMRTVAATGRRALADTRRLLGVLRADPLDDTGTGTGPRQPLPDLDGLDELVDRVRAAGLPVTLEIDGARSDLPPAVQLTVYRLVQEALTNTLKHGGPGVRSVVRLHHLPGEVRVEIDDDGAGAAAPVPAGVGSGLAGMRERVHAFGGDLDCGPGAHRGWQVVARLRLDEQVA